MSSVTEDIGGILDTALAAVSSLPQIAYENVKFSANASDAHIEVQFFVTSRRPAVRGPNPQMRYQGLYRLIVCVPTQQGAGLAFEHADRIINAFDGSTDILGSPVNVSIEYAELGSQFERDPHYCLPVEIAWYTYAQ
jgi:hypothetical protein